MSFAVALQSTHAKLVGHAELHVTILERNKSHWIARLFQRRDADVRPGGSLRQPIASRRKEVHHDDLGVLQPEARSSVLILLGKFLNPEC